MLYVGETESISQRLQQHRSQHSKNRGSSIGIGCIVLRVENKSMGRRIETRSIQILRKQGYLLQNSVSDECHILFGGGNFANSDD